MKTVLSVQSHVVHGYVGGRAATFPLQYLGWDVDNINTVNFSNHTGYGKLKGSTLLESDMNALFEGLLNISCTYDAVILGYIPTARLIDILAKNVIRMKKENKNLLYICDTVMGDQGHLYVDESCVEAYKNLLKTGVVDIITPNQFELELLCGFPIDSVEALRRAFKIVHKTFKVQHVVVSSLSGSIPLFQDKNVESIFCAISSDEKKKIDIFQIPEIKSYFTGVGDLLTALLLAKFSESPENLPLAVSKVLAIMSEVLKLTHAAGIEEYCQYKQIVPSSDRETMDRLVKGQMNDGETMRFFELRVIEARKFYDLSDSSTFKLFSI